MIGWPSRSLSGSLTPATCAKVAIKSRPPSISWFLTPAAILPGIHAMAGTRLPPSHGGPWFREMACREFKANCLGGLEADDELQTWLGVGSAVPPDLRQMIWLG